MCKRDILFLYVGWWGGAFLKFYNNIADPLPTSLYTNPQPITGGRT